MRNLLKLGKSANDTDMVRGICRRHRRHGHGELLAVATLEACATEEAEAKAKEAEAKAEEAEAKAEEAEAKAEEAEAKAKEAEAKAQIVNVPPASQRL